MSVILVAEQDAGYGEKIAQSLRSEGWTAQTVDSRDAAFRAAAITKPRLLLASASLPEAPQLLAAFSRLRGGPGAIVLVPTTASETAKASDYQADTLLRMPADDATLKGAVRSFLQVAGQGATRPPTEPPKSTGQQLTSADIFGDVLAEVEAEASRSRRAASKARLRASNDEIERKLEETLSGVFPVGNKPHTSPPASSGPPRPGQAPTSGRPKRRADLPTDREIDDLLDKTLSSLELPTRSRKLANRATPAKTKVPASPAAAAPGGLTPGVETPGVDGEEGAEGADNEGFGTLPQPEEDDDPEAIAARHSDTKLQTRLLPELLQRRLLSMFYDARTAIEEHGVNTLFLALGQLQWSDVQRPDIERRAPLVLLPVSLERTTAGARFRLGALEQEPSDNLSLGAKLRELGIEAPSFDWQDDFNFEAYCRSFEEAVVHRPSWKIHPNAIVLGFFSFAKFLMYRDLDPELWPAEQSLDDHPLVNGLLGDGFPRAEPPLPEGQHLDDLMPLAQLQHVVDADSSQALAVEEARRGRHMIIQGPPGTGKSQTIANLIATAVGDGKTVLFVAEKLAALDVVARRLDEIGLEAIALGLHSHRANKRQFLKSLAHTLKLGAPRSPIDKGLLANLRDLRIQLNDHAFRLNEPHQPCGLTVFQIIGQLTALQGRLDPGEIPVLTDAPSWAPDDYKQRLRLVEDLQSDLATLHQPDQHPWFGVGRFDLDRFDIAEIVATAGSLATSLLPILDLCRSLCERFRMAPVETLAEARDLGIRASLVARSPILDASALTSEEWLSHRQTLQEVVTAVRLLQDADLQIGERFTFKAWDTDMAQIRQQIATYGSSWHRIFHGSYRRAMGSLRGVLKTGRPPKDLARRLRWIDHLIEAQRHRKRVSRDDALAGRCFGSLWLGKPAWQDLQQVVDWAADAEQQGHLPAVLAMRSTIDQPGDCAEAAADLLTALDRFTAELQSLTQRLELDIGLSLGETKLADAPLATVKSRIAAWSQGDESLSQWMVYASHAQQARELGLDVLVTAADHGTTPASQLGDVFRLAYHRRLYRHIARKVPALQRFDGKAHRRRVASFRKLDRECLELARFEVLAKHHQGLPNHSSTAGVLGKLLSEMKRKRGHMPIRKLIALTGTAIQAIKPVFMMSPLSMAQFVPPGALTFDLVIFDEASQVEPVDALGAIARGRQLVVVGDEKQLPPTRFFTKVGLETGSDDPDDGTAKASDIESVLGLAEAKGLPSRMLRWHYRSRHPTLIAVSNEHFYDGYLRIVPSPISRSVHYGVKFHHVEDGTFSRGRRGLGCNHKEAQAVAAAVMRHCTEQPGASLGVAAFSSRQRNAILSELEHLRRGQLAAEPYFQAHPFEPFFVKNLENVQGDERDVIFISVGYAPDEEGNFPMRFGPLNNEGGERRLNVLITRAKQRCEVFSSIVADQIDTRRSKSAGVAALKAFLRFAQTGHLKTRRLPRGVDVKSPFVATVKRALESHAWVVEEGVGADGFQVDLAIVDAEDPGRFVLGILCDGSSYSAGRSARERDRQRQAILEAHGWRTHRIWSLDWFHRPQEQLDRLLDAIQLVKSASPLPSPQGNQEPGTERRKASRSTGGRDRRVASPYLEADMAVPLDTELHRLPADQLAEVVTRILEIEAPMHRQELTTRLRQLWRMARAGSRAREACQAAITSLIEQDKVRLQEGFLSLEQTELRLRDRTQVSSTGLRKPQFLPPQEIEHGILVLTELNHGLRPEEVAKVVSRALGFRALSAQLKGLIDACLERLLASDQLTSTDGILQRTRH